MVSHWTYYPPWSRSSATRPSCRFTNGTAAMKHAVAVALPVPKPSPPAPSPASAASSSTLLHMLHTPKQADLEVISAGAARHASDLRHALASNKKLLKWKVTTAPRIEALKIKVGVYYGSRVLPGTPHAISISPVGLCGASPGHRGAQAQGGCCALLRVVNVLPGTPQA